MDAVGFRLYFTPLTGVLFTVPSRYCALSVTTSNLPWTVGRPASHGIARVPWYSRSSPQAASRSVRDSHPLWWAVPDPSAHCRRAGARGSALTVSLTTPTPQRLTAWHGAGLGCHPVRSPLLRVGYYFLKVLRCFSSPGSLPAHKVLGHSPTDCGVAPFGHGRLSAWLPLPSPIAADRRPSSAGRAEASSDRASCLAWSLSSSTAHHAGCALCSIKMIIAI